MQLPILERSCLSIGCNMCCEVLGVKEISKPDHSLCSKSENNCCSIYENRPPSCRNYKCLWLTGEVDLQPNTSKLLFSKYPVPWWRKELYHIHLKMGMDNYHQATEFINKKNEQNEIVLVSHWNKMRFLYCQSHIAIKIYRELKKLAPYAKINMDAELGFLWWNSSQSVIL